MSEDPKTFKTAQQVLDYYIPRLVEERRREAEMKDPRLLADRLVQEFAVRLRTLLGHSSVVLETPHHLPSECPTWYDHCRCTVENLQHNIERADKAEAEVGRLRTFIEFVHSMVETQLNEYSAQGYLMQIEADLRAVLEEDET